MSIIRWSHITVKDLTQVSNIPWSEDCNWDLFLDQVDCLVCESPNPFDPDDIHGEYYCKKEIIEVKMPVPTNSHMRGYSSVVREAIRLERNRQSGKNIRDNNAISNKTRRIKIRKVTWDPRLGDYRRSIRSGKMQACNMEQADITKTKQDNLRLFRKYTGSRSYTDTRQNC